MGKLTAPMVRTLRERGKYLDGHGLLLNVVSADQRYWMFRYRRGDKERTMSLGSADVITLAEARKLHTEARALLAKGKDPLVAKRQAEPQRVVSFAHAALAYIEAHRAAWRPRSEQLWRESLALHVLPVFGQKPVGAIEVADVLSALQPIWVGKTVTATILRGRIELVLSYARSRGWREGENPARWRDHLANLLPKPAKVHTVEHRVALDWQKAPGLMAALGSETAMAARCLRFLMLTASRSGEARGCRWSEIDLDGAIWTIPPERMKGARQHRVPLSEPAMGMLRDVALLRTGDLVFAGRSGGMIHDSTLTCVLRRAGYDGVTVHGLRSTFRDWCADQGKPADLAEISLAHVVGSAVERAYRRSDVFERRRVLMDAWARFLIPTEAVVVPIPVAA
jgi:integrase